LPDPGGRIKVRILVPVVCALAAIVVIAIVSIYREHEKSFDKEIREKISAVRGQLERELDEDAQVLKGLAHLLARDENLRKAWQARDRQKMLALAEPLFRELRPEFRVTHFYFISPEKVCFLRVHNPPRHGDTIHRFTLEQAVRTQTVSQGIELGPYGTFTLRVVQPWFIEGRLAGYIELGEEIHHLTPEIKEELDVEFFLMVKKDRLDRLRWEEGIALLGRTESWDTFPHLVFIDRTTADMPPALHDYLAALNSDVHDDYLVMPESIALNDNRYRTGVGPLRDASGNSVGSIVVLKDVTGGERFLWNFSMNLLGIGGLVGFSLFGFFFFRCPELPLVLVIRLLRQHRVQGYGHLNSRPMPSREERVTLGHGRSSFSNRSGALLRCRS